MRNVVKAFHRKLLVFCMAMAMVILGTTQNAYADSTTVTVDFTVKYLQTDARTQEQLINEFRQSDDAWYWNSDDTTKTTCSNLGTLTWDYNLEKVCMQRAAEIALYYSHTRPNGDNCFSAYSELGYTNWTTIGENIAAGTGSYTTAQSVFVGWREDDDNYSGQGHRRNMLNSSYNRFACAGVYYNGSYYWVQEFAASSSSNSATTANDSNTDVQVSVLTSNLTTEIACDEDSIGLTVGETADLPEFTTTVITPYSFPQSFWSDSDWNPVNATYTYSIADTSIATVSNGKITGKKVGTTTLTVSTLTGTLDLTIAVAEEAHEHTWDSGVVTTEPTCSEEGVRTYTCTGCGQTKTESVDTVAHTWDEGEVYTKPTCAKYGWMRYTCTVCGSYSYGYIPKTEEHTWDDGVVTRASTCCTTGEITYTCTVCGATDGEALDTDPTAHVNTELRWAEEATCIAIGYTGDIVCADCGTIIVQGDYIPALGHTWDDGTVTTVPTCVDYGEKTYTCTVCNIARVDYIAPTDEHDYQMTSTTRSSCDVAGTAVYTCSTCGNTKTESLPAGTHAWNSGVVTKAADCSNKGVRTYTCSICGATKTEEIGYDSSVHNNTKVTGVKSATCTETGYTGDTVCSDCGTVITSGKTIAALGHNQVVRNASEATCGSAGYTGDTYCERCGEKLQTGSTIAKLTTHTWDDGVVTTPATSTSDGVKTYTCTVCGTTKTETIKAPHTVEEIQNELITLKYLSGSASGTMDDATVTAIKKFQLLNSLTITGEADDATVEALFGDDPLAFRTMNTGMKGDDVKAIQEYLVELGYLTATPDGSYGNYTKAAVTAFQAENGLEAVDGMCGNWTMNKLASGNSTAFFSFENGETGVWVKVMQKYLVDLKYLSTTPDGNFDDTTETALKKFQLLNSLEITGIANQETLYALFHVNALAFRTMNTGMKGDDVKAIQQYLVDLGYLTATPDGSYGNYTKAAVTAFQAANGLESVDGMCGNWTMNKLASGEAVAFFSFQKGETGVWVKVMQKYLVNLGYLTATPDGSFGNMSDTALKKFQLMNGLTVTGIADQETLYALYHVNAIARRTLQVGSTGDDVKAVQTLLVKLGYLNATPDGSYGNKTRQAVIAYQKARGLANPDGMVGNWTLGKLILEDIQ